MSYVAIDLRKVKEPVDAFVDVQWNEDKSVAFERWDNSGPQNYVKVDGINLSVKRDGFTKYETILNGKTFKFDFYQTDARCIFRCKKWNSTNSAIIATANAIGRVGKVYGGHIRYEWLMGVGYRQKTGFLSSNGIQLYYKDEDRNIFCLEFDFKKQVDVQIIAHEILCRAALYRLAMLDEKGADETEFLQKHSVSPMIPANQDPKLFSLIFFPNYYFAPTGADKRPK